MFPPSFFMHRTHEFKKYNAAPQIRFIVFIIHPILLFPYFPFNVPFTPFRAYETTTPGETGGGHLIGAGLLIRGF